MKKIFLTLAICLVALSGCTKQQRVRAFGGTEVIQVEPGKRVMMATWKEDNLFYMVEPMPEDYTPNDKELIESASFGVLESKIIFHETH